MLRRLAMYCAWSGAALLAGSETRADSRAALLVCEDKPLFTAPSGNSAAVTSCARGSIVRAGGSVEVVDPASGLPDLWEFTECAGQAGYVRYEYDLLSGEHAELARRKHELLTLNLFFREVTGSYGDARRYLRIEVTEAYEIEVRVVDGRRATYRIVRRLGPGRYELAGERGRLLVRRGRNGLRVASGYFADMQGRVLAPYPGRTGGAL